MALGVEGASIGPAGRGETLLVAKEDDFAVSGDAGAGPTLVVVGGLGEGAAIRGGSSPCLLCGADDVAWVFSLVLEMLRHVTLWEQRLVEAMCQDKGMGVLVDLLHKCFKNPMTVSDNSLKILGYTKDDECEELMWGESMREGWVAPGYEDVSAFMDMYRSFSRGAKRLIVRSDNLMQPFLSTPIMLGDKLLGTLNVVAKNLPITPATMDMASIAAGLLALELGKIEGSTAKTDVMAASLLKDVLDGEITDEQAIRERMHMLSWSPRRYLRLVCVAASNGAFDQSLVQGASLRLKALYPGKRSIAYRDSAVVVVDSDSKGRVEDASVRRLEGAFSSLGMSVGISAPFKSVSRMPVAYENARAAIRSGARRDTNSTVFLYEDYGFLRVREVLAGEGELSSFCHPGLEEVARYDESRGTELLKTLRCYLESNGSPNRTVERLHISRSTLSYRLGRIEELADVDLDDASDVFELQFSLRLLD